MRDELFHREYDQGRDALNAGIDRLIGKLAALSRSTDRINFNARWRWRTSRLR